MSLPTRIPYEGRFTGQGMVTLSFDDARLDNYTRAFPIMQEYGLLGSIHAITGWMDGTWNGSSITSSPLGAFSIEQAQEMHEWGIEISNHGDKHGNDLSNLVNASRKLTEWGLDWQGRVWTFASPGSYLTTERIPMIEGHCRAAGVMCARSGMADGAATRDARNNMDYPLQQPYRVTSQIVMQNTRVEELYAPVEDAIANRRWCIIMLHSILRPDDAGYGADNWYWPEERFRALCEYLASIPERHALVVTMRDGYRYAQSYREKVLGKARRRRR